MPNRDAGDSAYRHSDSVTLDSDGTGLAGEVVEMVDGEVTLMATGSTGTPLGILADEPENGKATVRLQGAYEAVVDAGVTAGVEVTLSGSNDGSLAAGAGPGWVTLTDESDGTAVVLFR